MNASQQAMTKAKIRAISQVLTGCGYRSIDEQAHVLNIPRSTAWTIFRGTHKNSGLTARIVAKMLASNRLPPSAKAEIVEYVNQKLAGTFGDNVVGQRRFKAHLMELGLLVLIQDLPKREKNIQQPLMSLERIEKSAFGLDHYCL